MMKELKRWKSSIYRRLISMKVLSAKIVVLIDGGVCSQMHQFLLGTLYSQKGYKVCYDMSFFKSWGSDLNHFFIRNFDLLKAFPYLKLDQISNFEIEVYKKKFYNQGNNTIERIDDFTFLEKHPPLYLGGYYHLPPELWLKTFHSLFHLVPEILDEGNRRLWNEIENSENSIAMHIRRGDLTVEVYSYGKPATIDYFYKATQYLKNKINNPNFYIFSDEPNWVRQELVPHLALENYKIVDINGSDKGYMDLYLIARCKHQITSKGTLGKYGAVLMDGPEKIVVLCDDITEYPWKNLLQNPIFL